MEINWNNRAISRSCDYTRVNGSARDDWTVTGVEGVDISGNEDVVILCKCHEPFKHHVQVTTFLG